MKTLRIIRYRLRQRMTRIKLRLFPRIHCAVCEKWVKPAKAVATIENDCCCIDCALEHNGLGKFEGYAVWSEGLTSPETWDDLEPLGQALILYAWSMSGSEDDFMSNEGWGYCARFGRFLMSTDTRGFIDFEEFDSDEKAEARFDFLYREGWGASEDDGYVFDDRNGYALQVAGKHIGTYPRLMRARAAMRLYAFQHGYYPNLWHEGERGGVHLLSY